MNNEMDTSMVEFDDERENCSHSCSCSNGIKWDSILLSALVGAVIGGISCFVYNNILSEEQRSRIKAAAVEKVRPALANIIAGEERF